MCRLQFLVFCCDLWPLNDVFDRQQTEKILTNSSVLYTTCQFSDFICHRVWQCRPWRAEPPVLSNKFTSFGSTSKKPVAFTCQVQATSAPDPQKPTLPKTAAVVFRLATRKRPPRNQGPPDRVGGGRKKNKSVRCFRGPPSSRKNSKGSAPRDRGGKEADLSRREC